MKKILLLLSASVLMFGCVKDSPAYLMFHSPNCIITDQSGLYIPDIGFSTMYFTVENNGAGPTAYNISIYVKIMQGDYIVDEGGTNFGTLEYGESISDAVYFTNISKFDNYDRMEVKLYWYDAEGNYFEQ